MQISWIALLAALPGVALLIVSTAARYSRLRARLFRNAIVGLYLSVSVFAFGAIVGAVFQTSDMIISLVFATSQLVYESILSLEVIEMHLHKIELGEY